MSIKQPPCLSPLIHKFQYKITANKTVVFFVVVMIKLKFLLNKMICLKKVRAT